MTRVDLVRQPGMRVLLWVGGVLAIGIGAFYGAVILASESGEVVALWTGSGSETRATRLWVVDHGGEEWVRTGHSQKGWFRQIRANALVELEAIRCEEPSDGCARSGARAVAGCE